MMKLIDYTKTKKIVASMFVLTSCLVVTACQHSGSYDLPAEHIPEPAGTRHNVLFSMQATKGEQYKYLLDKSSWYGTSTSLSPDGQHQVEWMVSQLDKNPYTVYVEPSGNHRIDETRRMALIEYFDLQGLGDAENFVIVSAYPFESVRADQE